MMQRRLEQLRRQGLVSDLGAHFARLMGRLAGEAGDELLLSAALVSERTAAGDVCVDLEQMAGRTLYTLPDGGVLAAPELDALTAALRRSPVVGQPGQYRPLVLDERHRLYLYRYWDYERRLADALLARAAAQAPPCDESRLRASLQRHFPAQDEDVDWQKVAAAVAALRRLCVISGGPGTGKTTTVVRLLAVLAEQFPGAPPAIGLAAPTGKAAARMREAVAGARATLQVTDEVRASIPEEASTVHRLLGVRPEGRGYRHHADNPVPLDVLVLDEASMVDLALMTRLVEALPSHVWLVLLGDRDQLASVEAGAVLADICGDAPGFGDDFAERVGGLAGVPAQTLRGGGAQGAITDSVVVLRRSYRFGGDSGIGGLARAVNAGNADDALALLHDPERGELRHVDTADLRAALREQVAPRFEGYFRAVREGAALDEVLEELNRLRVLAAHRSGRQGVEQLNLALELAFERLGWIDRGQAWYPGRPVMITRNDYGLRLFNGDVGIALPDPEAGGAVRVYFQTAEGGVRRFYPGRLPAHETVYAMTVHKSQGSEFSEVLAILPPEPSPILSRELLYTAITRARHGVEIWAAEAVLRGAIERRLQRRSGLRERLWAM